MSATDEFIQLRNYWIECLEGEDQNSVRNQLWDMVWNGAAYRTVNEARRLAPEAEEGGVQLNGMMHDLIDHCFWDSQLLAVRRLSDPSGPLRAQGKRDRSIFSLTALLKDMKSHIHLFTRRNIFIAENLGYDLATIQENYEAFVREKMRKGGGPSFTPRELQTKPSSDRHVDMDRLSGTRAGNRSERDCVQPVCIGKLERYISSACEQIILYVNKHGAHSATPESRNAQTPIDDITLGELFQAHETLCRTASAIGRYFLGVGGAATYLPHPVYDYLKYVDRPLVSSARVNDLKEFWHQLERENAGWEAWPIEELSPSAEQK